MGVIVRCWYTHEPRRCCTYVEVPSSSGDGKCGTRETDMFYVGRQHLAPTKAAIAWGSTDCNLADHETEDLPEVPLVVFSLSRCPTTSLLPLLRFPAFCCEVLNKKKKEYFQGNKHTEASLLGGEGFIQHPRVSTMELWFSQLACTREEGETDCSSHHPHAVLEPSTV